MSEVVGVPAPDTSEFGGLLDAYRDAIFRKDPIAVYECRLALERHFSCEWLGPYKNAAKALDELRRAVAEIIGADPETWPGHKNAPLAIASALALARQRLRVLEDRQRTDHGLPPKEGG